MPFQLLFIGDILRYTQTGVSVRLQVYEDVLARVVMCGSDHCCHRQKTWRIRKVTERYDLSRRGTTQGVLIIYLNHHITLREGGGSMEHG